MLVKQPSAQLFHNAGLEAEQAGNFALAHEQFADASAALAEVPSSLDVIVQSANVLRDDGFTYVREAIAETDASKFMDASVTLARSLALTAPLVSGTEPLMPQELWYTGTPKRARREVASAHGATLGLQGRLITARAVLLDIDTRDDGEGAANVDRNIDQQPYGAAHDTLRRGDNGYFLVSNAMAAARQERLNGRLVNMQVWLGRAGAGLAWTAAKDRRNLEAAALTFGNRLPGLGSYEAAKRSVLTKP